MITKWKREDSRTVLEMVDIDRLVPQKHPFRRLDRSVDWGRVYTAAESFYAAHTGRPSVDPAVVIRILLLSRISGKKTVRAVLRDAGDSIATRWFLGYCLSERLPSVSAVSAAICDRFDEASLVGILSGVLSDIETHRAAPLSAVGYPGRAALSPRSAGYEKRRTEALALAARRMVRSVRREFRSSSNPL